MRLMQRALHTSLLTWEDWAIMVVLALSLPIVGELWKWLMMRRSNR